MRYFVNIDGEEHVVEVAELPGGGHQVLLVPDPTADPANTVALPAEISHEGGVLTVHIDGQVFDLVLDGELPDVLVWGSGRRAALKIESARMRAANEVKGGSARAADGVLCSPMPGKVVKFMVAEGDAVEHGTPLVVVEAMKMENELVSPRAGVVQKIHAAPGEPVESGAKLITVG